MSEMELCLVAARHTLLLLILPKICKSNDAHACKTSNDIADYRVAVCFWPCLAAYMRCLFVDVIIENRDGYNTH